MRIPKRKKQEDKRKLQGDRDNHLTPIAIERMKRRLISLRAEQPMATEEVRRTQEMGDLSENAAYQDAKWRLRRINRQILLLEERIKNAIPIIPKTIDEVQIGLTVTAQINERDFTYTIVGSSETNPARGLISYSSPLGQAMIGKRIGDEIEIAGNIYKIKKIAI